MKNMTCPNCWGHSSAEDSKSLCEYCSSKGVVADLQLSPHFWLSEFLQSETATRECIANVPTPAVVAHLQLLCTQFLEPVRNQVGTLHVNSGFRGPKLNAAVKSKPTSAHPYGFGVDLVSLNGLTRKQLVDKIIAAKVKFDQVLFEGTWVHCGIFKPDGVTQRSQVLMTFNGGKTFEKYNPDDKRIHT